MKKIYLDGIVGYDIIPSKIKSELDEAKKSELEIYINSPGGFVYEGLAIFNLLSDYNKNVNKITMINSGLAASMASVIMFAGDKRKKYSNAVDMIHNVQSGVIGDYRDMQKEAREIEALTNVLAKIYSNGTGIDLKNIRKMMDEETFMFSGESLDNGFTNEIIDNSDSDVEEVDKESVVALANGRIKDCILKMKESKKLSNDVKKAVSLIDFADVQNQVVEETIIQTIDEKKTEVKKSMDLKELKNSFPDVYQEAVNIGVNQEKERVNAHIILGKQANAMEKAVEFIQNGKLSSDLTVQAEYMATGMKNQMKVARIEDNVPAIPTESVDNNSVEDTEKAIAEYKQRFGGKK